MRRAWSAPDADSSSISHTHPIMHIVGLADIYLHNKPLKLLCVAIHRCIFMKRSFTITGLLSSLAHSHYCHSQKLDHPIFSSPLFLFLFLMLGLFSVCADCVTSLLWAGSRFIRWSARNSEPTKALSPGNLRLCHFRTDRINSSLFLYTYI